MAKYKLVNTATNETLTYGDDNTVKFEGDWGVLQTEGIAIWEDNVQTEDEVKAEKLNTIRVHRNSLIYATVWKLDRHDQQLKLVASGNIKTTTISYDQYKNILLYIQALRDLPEDPNLDLDNPVYPTLTE